MAEKPCCAADALRRIRQINVNGTPTGITILDERISTVRELGFTDEREIREALMKQIKIYNYIPPGVQEAYTEAIMREYHAAKKKEGTTI
jgi:hypothetical protein